MTGKKSLESLEIEKMISFISSSGAKSQSYEEQNGAGIFINYSKF
jgi:hypothetical protein